MAVDDDQGFPGRLDFCGALGEFAERDQPAGRQGSQLMFPGLTHVQEINRFSRRKFGRQLLDRNLLHHEEGMSPWQKRGQDP